MGGGERWRGVHSVLALPGRVRVGDRTADATTGVAVCHRPGVRVTLGGGRWCDIGSTTCLQPSTHDGLRLRMVALPATEGRHSTLEPSHGRFVVHTVDRDYGPRQQEQVDRPLTEYLVGDVHVAALGVAGPGAGGHPDRVLGSLYACPTRPLTVVPLSVGLVWLGRATGALR